LAKDKIDQMIKDAEAYAEEDAKRRESVETRNRADQLLHQTEKLVEEQGDQMTDDEKASINSAVASLREVTENPDSDIQDVQTKMDELIQVSQAMATRLYQQAAATQADDTGDTSGQDEDIVEAEIVDEDE
jgi:molecular chaperone DnaK